VGDAHQGAARPPDVRHPRRGRTALFDYLETFYNPIAALDQHRKRRLARSRPIGERDVTATQPSDCLQLARRAPVGMRRLGGARKHDERALRATRLDLI
jgi:hypothetical protein